MKKLYCKNCGKEFSKKEVIRIYGDAFWSNSYCSAMCYSDAFFKGENI